MFGIFRKLFRDAGLDGRLLKDSSSAAEVGAAETR
jgi:hypothetical protein